MRFKKIGVLTSGGDAPGMNALVRSVVRAANKAGVETLGIYEGYQGLMDGNIKKLTPENVANIIGLGGTMLYTARALEFKEKSGMQKALDNCKKFGIDGIVAIGGDGTFRGATDLSAHGIPTIGLTGTIDNDITATDYTTGFDTAMNAAIECIERLRDTSESHARCSVIEVMGREAGYIALQVGIAVGACGVAIPEVSFDEAALMENIKAQRQRGQRSFIVLVSEGVKDENGKHIGEGLTKRIEAQLGVESRFVRLAHIIRGGAPSLKDRLSASLMGEKAVELLLEGKSDVVVCERENEITTMDIAFALTLDRMYKGKLKDGELGKFTDEQVAEMRRLCEIRRKEICDMYALFLKMS